MNLDRTQTAQDLADRATAALEAAQPGEANALIRLAIRQNPDDPELRLLDAKVQLRRNLPEFALVALDSRDQLDPDRAHDPQIALLRAEALMAAAFDDLAFDLLRELAAVLPHDPRPHRMLAGICLKRGQSQRAAEHLREVRRLDPHDTAAGRLLATVLEASDPRAAVEVALDAAAHHGADAAQDLRAARMCRHTGRLRDAAELYRRLLAAQPDDAALWLEAADLATELGESDLALRRLEHAAGLGRRYRPAALEALARVQMHGGRLAAAAGTWWRRARLAPGDARPWAGLWLCARGLGRGALARGARRRLEAASTAAERCRLLAELWPHLAAARACAAAEGDAAELAAASPLDDLTRYARGALEEHAAAHPDRADVFFHRAVCQHALGDRDGAIASLERALAMNPAYVAAQRMLGALRRADRSRGGDAAA